MQFFLKDAEFNSEQKSQSPLLRRSRGLAAILNLVTFFAFRTPRVFKTLRVRQILFESADFLLTYS